jgi:hypothetical protein
MSNVINKFRRGIFAVLILGLGTASVNAQITFSAWGRGVVTPLAFTKDDNGVHSAVSAITFTSMDRPVIGFTANGRAPSGQVGFNIDLAYGGGVVDVGDNAKVWVKPFEIFTLTAGLFKEEELRGKIGSTEFAAWLLPNSSKNEDNIFQRFDALAGAHFKLEPLKWIDSPWSGLSIHGAFGSNASGQSVNNVRAILNLFTNEDNETAPEVYDESDGDHKMSALDVYKAMQIALAYRIPDIGLARAQFIGNNRNVFRWGEVNQNTSQVDKYYEKKLVSGISTNKDSDIIEAAFLFDRIKGLNVDVGTKIPLEYTTKTDFIVYPRVVGTDGIVKNEIKNSNKNEYTVQAPIVIAAGASWTPGFLEDLNILGRVDFSFGGKIESEETGIKVKNGSIFSLLLVPSYKIGVVKVGLDIGFETHGLDTLAIRGQNPDKPRTDASEYTDFGLGPWAELNFSGGKIRTGIVMMLPGTPRYVYNANSVTYAYSPRFRAEPVFSIPISFTYNF